MAEVIVISFLHSEGLAILGGIGSDNGSSRRQNINSHCIDDVG